MVQPEHNLLKKLVGTHTGVWVWQGFQKRYPNLYLANPDPPVQVLLTCGLPYLEAPSCAWPTLTEVWCGMVWS